MRIPASKSHNGSMGIANRARASAKARMIGRFVSIARSRASHQSIRASRVGGCRDGGCAVHEVVRIPADGVDCPDRPPLLRRQEADGEVEGVRVVARHQPTRLVGVREGHANGRRPHVRRDRAQQVALVRIEGAWPRHRCASNEERRTPNVARHLRIMVNAEDCLFIAACCLLRTARCLLCTRKIRCRITAIRRQRAARPGLQWRPHRPAPCDRYGNGARYVPSYQGRYR